MSLTEKARSAKSPRVGRPKMDVKATVVRLPEGVGERIDALCGKNRRAEFIREAVERELSRRERSKPKE